MEREELMQLRNSSEAPFDHQEYTVWLHDKIVAAMATPSKVDSILLKEHAKAFMLPGLPVNPRPFLRMLDQCVKEQGTDFIKTPEAKGLLFTLMLQAYNGLIPHDIWEAMNKVKEAL